MFFLQEIVTDHLLQYAPSTDVRVESWSIAGSLILIIFVFK